MSGLFSFNWKAVMSTKKTMSPVYLVGLLFVVPLLASIGCGDSGPELAQVSGVVTLDGKPLDRAAITFHPEKGRGSFATTDDQGRYTMGFAKGKLGATIGKHKVTITSEVFGEEDRNAGSDYEEDMPDDATTGARGEILAEKYRIREKTVLSASVAAGDNEINFELESN